MHAIFNAAQSRKHRPNKHRNTTETPPFPARLPCVVALAPRHPQIRPTHASATATKHRIKSGSSHATNSDASHRIASAHASSVARLPVPPQRAPYVQFGAVHPVADLRAGGPRVHLRTCVDMDTDIREYPRIWKKRYGWRRKTGSETSRQAAAETSGRAKEAGWAREQTDALGGWSGG